MCSPSQQNPSSNDDHGTGPKLPMANVTCSACSKEFQVPDLEAIRRGNFSGQQPVPEEEEFDGGVPPDGCTGVWMPKRLCPECQEEKSSQS